MEDWDLQAVVRGCGGATATATQARTDDPLSCWRTPLPEDNKDFIFCFPNLVGEEEEDLWKPFFLKPESQQPQSSTPNPSCSSSVSFLKPKKPLRPLSSQTTRSKRRKKQQKKVICQVPTNGLSSDMWAWRKYGQKPIKGSPFPRGYYKCSSSKECSARKQVERSRTDPGLYTITYTGEHNHPVPTHRNSLAGSTRQKFPASSRLSPSSSVSEAEKVVEEGEVLMVSDMEVLGEDEMVILGFEEGSPEWFAGGGW